MKFGIKMPGIDLYPAAVNGWESGVCPNDLVRIARQADDLGYDWLSVPEHIVMFEETVEIMGPRWSHAVTTIAFLAGVTKRIRVLNNVLVLPYHNPIELAKMLSTVDFLSGGRLTVGLGVGASRREFRVLNMNFEERGAISDEFADAMIELWTMERPTFNGRYVHFDRIVFEPKPVQKPYPPIWVGGNTKISLRRAARLGDGWTPSYIDPTELPTMLAYLDKHKPTKDRQGRPFDVIMPLFSSKIDMKTHRLKEPATVATSRDEILDAVGRLVEAGATGTHVTLRPTTSADDYLEALQWFQEEIFPKP